MSGRRQLSRQTRCLQWPALGPIPQLQPGPPPAPRPIPSLCLCSLGALGPPQGRVSAGLILTLAPIRVPKTRSPKE